MVSGFMRFGLAACFGCAAFGDSAAVTPAVPRAAHNLGFSGARTEHVRT